MSFICALSWAALAWYIYFVIQDFTRILDINVFTIKHKKDPKELAGKLSSKGK